MLKNITSQLLPTFKKQAASESGEITSRKLAPHRLQLSIITQFFPPDYAATGQLIADLSTRLQQLGLQVKVFSAQPGYAFQQSKAPAKETMSGVRVRRSSILRRSPQRIRGKLLGGILFFLRATVHLLRSANRGDLLLLTTEPPYLPILGYFAHIFFGLPYVCLIYDLYPEVAVKLRVVHQNHFIVRFWKWMNGLAWKNASQIVVPSQTMKDRICAQYPQLMEKISVIHNWADPDNIQPIRKQDNWFAHKYELVDKFVVLYSGNMGRCHDMDTILAAAEQLRHEPVQFVFIGNGAQRSYCEEQVEKLGLNNCLFLPYQDRSVLPYSLTACDLSLVSLRPGLEGLIAPSKLYGILAAGRPVAAICEPHSYLRKLLSAANCGKAFESGCGKHLADFIRQLKNRPTLRQAMGRSGRRYLQQQFTLETIARKYFKILSWNGSRNR